MTGTTSSTVQARSDRGRASCYPRHRVGLGATPNGYTYPGDESEGSGVPADLEDGVLLLGETVQHLRHEKGWSVLRLSKRSGVPEQVIEALESGRPYVPSEANTALLAEALGRPAGPMLVERERLSERYWGSGSRSTNL